MKHILNTIKYITILIFISLTSSCKKDWRCGDGILKLNLISYSNQEIDTLIIKQFKPTNPRELIYTGTLIKDINVRHIKKGDTTIIQLSSPDLLSQSFDWEIFIPSVNRTIIINSIVGERRIEEVGSLTTKYDCINQIFSFVVDGIKITIPSQNGVYDPPNIYIKR